MVNVRLQGYPEEVERVKNDLKTKGIKITRCSPPYQNRGDKRVRVYMEITPKETMI